jgi:hypothetical protein
MADEAREAYEEREKVALGQWELERAGMMEEIKEIEQNYALDNYLIAKERMKNLMFRFRILNKVQKLKEINKDTYDFTKASLEVQALLKFECEHLIKKESSRMQA